MSACSTAVPAASLYNFNQGNLAGVQQAIRKPIKVGSKVALRFAGA
jgi:hypothetical protein